MNREIECKAWDKNNEEMVEVISINLKPDQTYQMLAVQYPDGEVIEEYLDSFELLWYTGLTDKNGNEIYEGDIIEFFGNSALVRFAWGGFVAADGEGELKHTTKGDLRGYHANSEVIGNKFENPELLETIQQ